MKQYCVDYVGIITILAESEEEAREKFKVAILEESDWAEVKAVEYICEVYKHTPRSRLRSIRNLVERAVRIALRRWLEKRKAP